MQVAKGDQNVYPVPGGLAGPVCPGVINTVDWPSRLEVGRQSDNLSPQKSELLGNIICGFGTARLRGIDLHRGQGYVMRNEDSNLESGIV
jgi:hypothetical protein